MRPCQIFQQVNSSRSAAEDVVSGMISLLLVTLQDLIYIILDSSKDMGFDGGERSKHRG